jgi:N-acetyl-anhydromuramyl-L-alanine amidase AmpD
MATETWYPAAVRLPISTREYFKDRGMPILAICDHITAGSDSRGWLQNADNQSSVHFLIRVERGAAVVYQFMPIEWAAWGNGRHSGTGNPFMPGWVRDQVRAGVNPNLFTVSIEHEGVVPKPELYTGPMLDASIALHKWLVNTVPTIPRDRDHVIGHYQIDHIQRPFCPGGAGGSAFPFGAIVAALQPAEQTSDQKLTEYARLHAANRNAGLLVLPTHKRILEDGNEWDVRVYERWIIHTKPGLPVFEARDGWMYLKAKGEI